MSRTSLTRWALTTLVFLAIGWVDVTRGHRWGVGLLVAALLVVFVFGGTSKRGT